jgi:hypothetical protein
MATKTVICLDYQRPERISGRKKSVAIRVATKGISRNYKAWDIGFLSFGSAHSKVGRQYHPPHLKLKSANPFLALSTNIEKSEERSNNDGQLNDLINTPCQIPTTFSEAP